MLRRLRMRLAKGERLTSETRELVEKVVFQRTERFLDEGYGRCELADRENAELVDDSLRYYSETRIELGALVAMPNHVNEIIKPTNNDLDDVLKSIKSYTATRIRKRTDTSGQLWQHEGYDRIIRDDEHLWRCLQYIGRNGFMAGIDAPRWVNPQWQQIGWDFRDRTDER